MTHDADIFAKYLFRHITNEQYQAIKAQPASAVRRWLAKRDLGFFCEYYLKPYFTKPFAVLHRELIADLEEIVKDPMGRGEAVAFPRGHGKTTLAGFAFALWCAVTGKKHFVVIIQDSFEQAKTILEAIKTEAESNERLRADFGEMQGEIWQEAEIIVHCPATDADCKVVALGTGMKIRGRKYKQWRPDLIIGDDLENDENVESPVQRRKRRRWWFRAVMKAGTIGTDIVLMGTLIHYDCLLMHVLAHPFFRARVYKALLQEAARQDLWGQWKQIFTDLSNENRAADALAFFEQHREEMLAGTEVAWPEGVPYYQLMVMRVEPQSEEAGIAVASFDAEMQNEPLSELERRFHTVHYYVREWRNEDWWLVPVDVGEAARLRECTIGGVIDPAMGVEAGDFAAILTGAMSPSGYLFVLDAHIERLHPDRQVEAILEKARHWGYKAFGVESVGFQEMLVHAIQKASAVEQLYLNVVPLLPGPPKPVRIDSLQPDITNGYILLRGERRGDQVVCAPEMLRLRDQLFNYPKDYDDGPDALEMLRRLLRSLRETGPVVPEMGRIDLWG